MKLTSLRAAIFTVIILATLQIQAQQMAAPSGLNPEIQAADAAYRSHNWAVAKQSYARLAEEQPASPQYWYRLAMAAHASGDQPTALSSFQKAGERGIPKAIIAYNLACVYSAMGDTPKGLEQLQQAVNSGYAQTQQMKDDKDLQPLRADARFDPLLKQVERNEFPCKFSDENRKFDFWVGDWDVVSTANGASQGASHVARELGDCVIWENWTSLGGSYAGKSYNIFNPGEKRWEQFWVDNRGQTTYFSGTVNQNVMDYWTNNIPQPDGTRLKRHLQFFNLGPDKVRQFSQATADDGKTWKVEYDLTYLRKK